MAAVVLILIYLCLWNYAPERMESCRPALLALVSITVVLTISSGFIYVVSNRRLFSGQAPPPPASSAGSSR
jgi:hypothetical protein